MMHKFISFANIYFYLTGLFKYIEYSKDVSSIDLPLYQYKEKENNMNENKYKKIVYIVLDALRFDNTIKTDGSKYLHNNMSFLSSLENKFHALSVCGIPTSTTCRVIGLLTGAPSNYLEGVKTFLTLQIQIDNLINQICKHKSVSFFGDKTWIDLCPALEKRRNYKIDPYSKECLIEDEIKAMDELLNDIGKREAIFGHFITLDSFGHIYGTEHEIMKDTLLRFDNFIKKVYEKIDEDTLLVLTSDHGVTDQGAHGGISTMEMSSFCVMVSKKKLKIEDCNNDIVNERLKSLSQFYDFNDVYFKTSDKYHHIHQDDILPTICYMLNIPIPIYSSGNFIHELVNDETCYKEYLHSKKAMLTNYKENFFLRYFKRFSKQKDVKETKNLIKDHYSITREIYQRYAGKNDLNLTISLFISLFSCIFLYKNKKSIKNFEYYLLIGVIIMVSHSVHSIIHEDMLWLGLFLILNLNILNCLGGIIYMGIDKNYGSTTNTIHHLKTQLYFNPKFGITLIYGNLFLPLLILFCLSKSMTFTLVSLRKSIENFLCGSLDLWNKKKRKFDKLMLFCNLTIKISENMIILLLRFFKFTLKTVLKDIVSYPYLILSIYKYIHPEYFTVENNLNLFFSMCSIESLCLLVFKPYEFIFIYYVSPNLSVTNNVPSVYSLINMSVGYSGLMKQIQSINYNVPYTFTLNPDLASSLAPAMIYLIYPRYTILRRFKVKEYHLIDLFNLLLVFACTYYLFDTMSFYFHFASRCFFICFYYVVDSLLCLF